MQQYLEVGSPKPKKQKLENSNSSCLLPNLILSHFKNSNILLCAEYYPYNAKIDLDYQQELDVIKKFASILASMDTTSLTYNALNLISLIVGAQFRSEQDSLKNLSTSQYKVLLVNIFRELKFTEFPTDKYFVELFKRSKGSVLINNFSFIEATVEKLETITIQKQPITHNISFLECYKFSYLLRTIFNPEMLYYSCLIMEPFKELSEEIFKKSQKVIDIIFPMCKASFWLVKCLSTQLELEFPDEICEKIAEHFFALPSQRRVCKATNAAFLEMNA